MPKHDNRYKLFLIDFDDTIHDTEDVRPGHKMGAPEPGAVAAVRELYNAGHKIWIFTGRPVQDQRVYKAVYDWLVHFQIPFDNITNVKPDGYDFIIDNRAIHYNNWSEVRRILHTLLENERLENEYVNEHYKGTDIDYKQE